MLSQKARLVSVLMHARKLSAPATSLAMCTVGADTNLCLCEIQCACPHACLNKLGTWSGGEDAISISLHGAHAYELLCRGEPRVNGYLSCESTRPVYYATCIHVALCTGRKHERVTAFLHNLRSKSACMNNNILKKAITPYPHSHRPQHPEWRTGHKHIPPTTVQTASCLEDCTWARSDRTPHSASSDSPATGSSARPRPPPGKPPRNPSHETF